VKNEPAAKIDDGGPAFPVLYGQSQYVADGLTLRDWVAGQVLAGYAKDHRLQEQFAHHAYVLADAMLQERAKR
jgi:hypothetical protein